jgi:single-strand DNA-binding protein
MTEFRLPDVNRVLLSGRLTRDPDLRYASDGTQITSFTLAFHRYYKAPDGQWAQHPGFVVVKTYETLAENCGKYLHRGSAVLVEGRLQMREWTAAQGEKQQRLEIRAEQVHFLERLHTDAGPEAPAPPNEPGGGA